MEKSKIVMQPYEYTMSKHDLTAIEIRIMSMLLMKLKDAQIEVREDVVEVRDLFDRYSRITLQNADLTLNENYSHVYNALRRLRQREVEMKVEGGMRVFGLINEFYYSDDKSMIEVDVSPSLLPELITLGNNYTKFGLEFMFKTNSAHAMRWYQIGSHWLNKGVFTMTVDAIRLAFRIKDGRYPQHKDLKKWVIKNPLDELNSKADINIEIAKVIKTGRRITGYTFSVSLKKLLTVDSDSLEQMNTQALLYWQQTERGLKHICAKYSYDLNHLLDKIKTRPQPVTNGQRHYNNVTDMYVAKVLSERPECNVEAKHIADEIKEFR